MLTIYLFFDTQHKHLPFISCTYNQYTSWGARVLYSSRRIYIHKSKLESVADNEWSNAYIADIDAAFLYCLLHSALYLDSLSHRHSFSQLDLISVETCINQLQIKYITLKKNKFILSNKLITSKLKRFGF